MADSIAARLGQRIGGYFIFEGIDGAGKSSQIRRLAASLEYLGHLVVCSAEPTAGRYGREIRERARHGPAMSFDEEIELFVADRREHVLHTVAPALRRGDLILQDRSFYSTVAYQGARPGAGPDELARLMELNAFAPRPELVFLLDLPARDGLDRVAARGASDAFEELDRLRRVRANFLALADDRFVVLDATLAADDIAAEVRRRALERLARAPEEGA
jgi:dTMP kinase